MDECLSKAFETLILSKSLKIGDANLIQSNMFAENAIASIYDVVRKSKKSRQDILRLLLSKIADSSKRSFDDKFKHTSFLNPANQYEILGKFNATELVADAQTAKDYEAVSKRFAYRYLYCQFLALLVGSLRFEIESEPLYVIHECNRILMLNAE